jgi:hypothetical protein
VSDSKAYEPATDHPGDQGRCRKVHRRRGRQRSAGHVAGASDYRVVQQPVTVPQQRDTTTERKAAE